MRDRSSPRWMRQELSQVAVKLFGYSEAEGARYLGVTNSCITRGLAPGSIPEEVRARCLAK